MDENLRPVITSASMLLVLFVILGSVFKADVPVPGTAYLLVPALALLSFYMSFEGMGKYVSAVLVAEGRRWSRRTEPIPPVLKDGPFEWLFVSCGGWQFIRYVLNQPNVDDGIGTIIVAPPYLVESENRRVIVVRGQPMRASPYLLTVLMQRRKWRLMFQRFDGFDPLITKVYFVLFSTTMHPDSVHYAEAIGNLPALSNEWSANEQVFGHVDANLQKRLMDEIALFHTITRSPEESRAINRPPQEVEEQ